MLDHRLALYDLEQRMVFGANTYRLFARMLASSTEESEVGDPWVTRMWSTANLIRRNADFVISAESGFASVVLLVSDSLSIIGNADTDHDGHQQQARGAVRRHHVGDGRIPSIKPGLVSKYVDDLRVLGLLEPWDEADATFGAEAHREMVGARRGT